jgi:hypothetical protein
MTWAKGPFRWTIYRGPGGETARPHPIVLFTPCHRSDDNGERDARSLRIRYL